jgi:hypothetical protein
VRGNSLSGHALSRGENIHAEGNEGTAVPPTFFQSRSGFQSASFDFERFATFSGSCENRDEFSNHFNDTVSKISRISLQ